jgi:hypothetical protein
MGICAKAFRYVSTKLVSLKSESHQTAAIFQALRDRSRETIFKR